MLENSLFESRGHEKTRKPLTVIISAAVHVVTIVVLGLIPLAQTQAVTMPAVDLSLWAPVSGAAKAREERAAVQPRVQPSIRTDPNVLTTPDAIPDQIAMVNEPLAESFNLPPSDGNDKVGAFVREIFSRSSGTPEAPPAASPPPPPPPPPVEVKPLRIGGKVQDANLIHQVKPVYPDLAKRVRVQGPVLLEAVISKEGTIQSLRVISGHQMLVQSALDAVQQWRYRPTLLNGDPVEVVTTITVTFTLQ
jgi:protein TonB